MSEPVDPSSADREPRLSIVVPARNCPDHVRFCLGRLESSEERDVEVLVVDDASTDDTAAVAEALGARVIRLPRWAGPAEARNAGAAAARAPIVFFVDADVGVYPGTVGHVLAAFEADPDTDALFGSYDTRPDAPNFLSQYRNLFHHFVHQAGSEQASTFWSGCGAIRRDLFLEHGGFDPQLYGRPSIEDIELGARLVRAGHRIRVVKHIQVTHLKRWTLWGMIRTDVWDRGIPWTRLILREGAMPDDLNTGVRQRVSLVLAGLVVLALLVGAWFRPELLLLPLGLWASVLLLDRWTESGPVPAPARALLVAIAVGGIGALAWRAPAWAATSAVLTAGIVLLNRDFYGFYLRERGVGFTALVVPLHVLYFLYSGLAFAAGLALHVAKGPLAAPSERTR